MDIWIFSAFKLFMEQNLVYDSTIIMELAMRLRVCDQ